MEEPIEKQIEKRLAELPEAIQEAILSNDIGGHVRTIGSSHKLHVDQLAILEDLTIMTMLGFSPNTDFQNQLKIQLSLDEATSQKLAADINTEIFLVVRESLKNPAPAAAAPAAPATPTSASVVTPVKITTPTAPVPTPAPKPAELHPADLMLSQKTVTAAPMVPPVVPKPVAPAPGVATPAATVPATAAPQPPAPKPYVADPYREPAE